jgi:hypothetical protein
MRTSKALQAAIHRQQAGRRTKATRYTASLKRSIGEHVRSRRSSGASLEGLSVELGLPVNTLRRWSGGVASGRLARVEVSECPQAREPVLVMRSGHRVEGLTIAGLVELLARLP